MTIGTPMFAITDTETGGLKPEKNALTQVSVIVVDENLNEIEAFATKIYPRAGYTVEPAAAEINGYNEEEWKQIGMDADQADRSYAMFLDQFFKDRAAIGVAHNAAFDAKFLAHHMPNAYARYLQIGGPDRKLHDGWYCTMVALKEWRSRCKYAGTNKLGDLAQLASYEIVGKAHDALVDTRTCLAGMRWLQQHKDDTF